MLFDLHCDTLHEIYEKKVSLYQNRLAFDLHRFSAYSPRCQVMAIWVDDRFSGEDALNRFLAIYRSAQESLKENDERAVVCLDGEDLRRATGGQSRAAVFLALENGSAFNGELVNIDRLYRLGVRFVTLTWNGENQLGYGCLSENKGLKGFGKAAVRRMEELGMIVDVSHLSDRGFEDVAALCARPFIATHSNARSVCDHPRNLTDEQFLEIRRRGGIVGLNLYPRFLRGEAADFDDVRRHLEHFLALGGETILALGGDLDGASLPPDFHGVESYRNLFEYLLSKNMEETLLHRVFFRNAYEFCVRALTNSPLSDMIKK